MIRKWSYLTEPLYKDSLPNWKNDYFMWRFRFLSLRKKSIRVRKKRLSLRIITKIKKRRNYVKQSHYKSPFYFKLFIFKDWVLGYNNSRQFWRFYQMYGLMNTLSQSINPPMAVNLFSSLNIEDPVSFFSISSNNLLNVTKFIKNINRSIFHSKTVMKYGFSYFHIHTDNYILNDNYNKLGSFSVICDRNIYENNFILVNQTTYLNDLKLFLDLIFKLVALLTLELYKTLIVTTKSLII